MNVRRFTGTPILHVRPRRDSELHLFVAKRPSLRLVGLVGLRQLPCNSGLLIPDCAWVHTIGMRFSLDVAFVSWPPASGRLEVARVAEHLAPFRSARHNAARAEVAALEVPAGHARKLGLEKGVSLEVLLP